MSYYHNRRKNALLLLLCQVIVTSSLSAAGPSSVYRRATGDICAGLGMISAIVGGELLFGGGYVSFDEGSTLVPDAESRLIANALYSLNLRNAFTVGGFLAKEAYKVIDLPNNYTIQDPEPLLYDNSTLYYYNPYSPKTDNMLAYNVSEATWANSSILGSTSNPEYFFPSGWASDPGSGLSWYSGWWKSGLTKRSTASPILQVLDTTISPPEWTTKPGAPLPLVASQMNYIRAGTSGILVLFGGVEPEAHSEFAQESLGDYSPMDQIFVYDIDGEKWYNVSATGENESDIPIQRINFCSSVASAPDDSTFQITIYGGSNLFSNQTLETVHVLTIPTFQWIDVTPAKSTARTRHTCSTWKDAQMIVVGGLVTEPGAGQGLNYVNNEGCNSSVPALLVLDTTSFEWKDQFTQDQKYSQPAVIYRLVGGDYRGIARARAPEAGWPDPALETIFSKVVPRMPQPVFDAVSSSSSSSPSFPSPFPSSTTRPSSPSQPSTSVTPSSTPSTVDRGLGSGAIAGVLISTLAASTIFALLLIARFAPHVFQSLLCGRFRDRHGSDANIAEVDGSRWREELDSTVRHEAGGEKRVSKHELASSTIHEMSGGRSRN